MKAYIGAVLDRSGSMAAVGRQAVDGLNGFVEEQKQTSPDAGLCIVAFNHRHEIISAGYISGFRPIAHKEYKANGTTALYDAILYTVDVMSQVINNLPEAEKPDKVAVAIMTDGMDNESEHKPGDVKDVIERKEKEGWTFVFLAANIDVAAAATQMGISHHMGYTATGTGTLESYRTMSRMITAALSDSGVQ